MRPWRPITLPDVVRRHVQPEDERVVLLDLLDAHRRRVVDELARDVVEQLRHAAAHWRFLALSRR